jgi:hypothetical protein
MTRYLKFIQYLNNILKVCILPDMTMMGLIGTTVASEGLATCSS